MQTFDQVSFWNSIGNLCATCCYSISTSHIVQTIHSHAYGYLVLDSVTLCIWSTVSLIDVCETKSTVKSIEYWIQKYELYLSLIWHNLFITTVDEYSDSNFLCSGHATYIAKLHECTVVTDNGSYTLGMSDQNLYFKFDTDLWLPYQWKEHTQWIWMVWLFR